LATGDDIRSAYRLILGRLPDETGWADLSARIGALTVEELVQGIVESTEFRSGRLAGKIAPALGHDLEVVELDGFQMLASYQDNAVGRCIVEDGDYEHFVTAELLGHLEPGATFLDIGCNIGWYAMNAAKVVGAEGRVIAIEASPDVAAISTWNAALNGYHWVEVKSFGADDEAGTAELERWRGTNAQFVTDERLAAADGPMTFTTTVRTYPLDDVLGPLPRLDVVKLDIEGAEGRAVKGAAKLLETHRPVVFSEFSPLLLNAVSSMSGLDYLRWFTDRGWEVAVVGEGRGPEEPEVVQSRWEDDRSRHLDVVFTPRR
jgi:FkbM family methyltransferase